jgi:hypothetical protein
MNTKFNAVGRHQVNPVGGGEGGELGGGKIEGKGRKQEGNGGNFPFPNQNGTWTVDL